MNDSNDWLEKDAIRCNIILNEAYKSAEFKYLYETAIVREKNNRRIILLKWMLEKTKKTAYKLSISSHNNKMKLVDIFLGLQINLRENYT